MVKLGLITFSVAYYKKWHVDILYVYNKLAHLPQQDKSINQSKFLVA